MIDVLCVATKLCLGGVQTFLINNVEPLLKYGVRLNFIVQTDDHQIFDDYVEGLGCKIFRVTSLNKSRIKFMRDIRRILKSHPEYKIIHSHQNFANAYSLIAAHSLPVRISHSHSYYEGTNWLNKILKSCFKFCLPIVATDFWGCSDKSNKWLYGKYIHSERCQLIKNAINTDRFKFNYSVRQDIRDKMGLCDKLVWCHVGTFSPVKNHNFLLHLFAKFIELHSESHLLLCGSGVCENEIKLTIKELNLKDKVSLLGGVTNPEKYLWASDLFVLPSFIEGFPLSSIEAQATGIPCVVSDAVPNEAIINENVSRIKGYRYEDYLMEIDKVLSMDFQREKAFENIIKSGFDINSEADRLSQLYKKALER